MGDHCGPEHERIHPHQNLRRRVGLSVPPTNPGHAVLEMAFARDRGAQPLTLRHRILNIAR